jgi:hypothetical protein
MNIEKIARILTSPLPPEASIEIKNYARLQNGKIVFNSNESVIGVPDPDDPDGGRMILSSATVETEDIKINFFYREKYWSGLEFEIEPFLTNKEIWSLHDEFLGDSNLPVWAEQE